MGLKPKFNEYTIRVRFEKILQLIENLILTNLSYLGEKALIECRSNANFIDRTGNLRSSMGYIIVKNGKVLGKNGFENQIGTTIFGKQGAETGENLALKLASNQEKDKYVLIVVAGMNYAVYVESKNYNVLTSAEQLVQRELPEIIRNIKKSMK